MFLYWLASSNTFLITDIGLCVEVPLRTEQLLPSRTLSLLQVVSILLVMVLVKIFLRVSINVIGLVLSMFIPQSVVFGIGMMFALFHSLGVFSSDRILLNKVEMDLMTSGVEFFQHSYVILDGPAALLFGNSLMICSISS